MTYHREDGPAFEFWFGTKYWYIDGRCHRTDGPARRYGNDGVVTEEWLIDGRMLTKRGYEKRIREIKDMDIAMRLTDPRKWVREFK